MESVDEGEVGNGGTKERVEEGEAGKEAQVGDEGVLLSSCLLLSMRSFKLVSMLLWRSRIEEMNAREVVLSVSLSDTTLLAIIRR